MSGPRGRGRTKAHARLGVLTIFLLTVLAIEGWYLKPAQQRYLAFTSGFFEDPERLRKAKLALIEQNLQTDDKEKIAGKKLRSMFF